MMRTRATDERTTTMRPMLRTVASMAKRSLSVSVMTPDTASVRSSYLRKVGVGLG